MEENEVRSCNNCGNCWHSNFNGCVCMDGWGENGCDVAPDDCCEDWIEEIGL